VGNYFCPRATLRPFRCLAGQIPVKKAIIQLNICSSGAGRGPRAVCCPVLSESLVILYSFYLEHATECAGNCGLHTLKYQTNNFFLFLLSLFEPLKLGIFKKNKAQAHLPLCVCVSRHAYVIPSTCFLLHKGHDPWHTLYVPMARKIFEVITGSRLQFFSGSMREKALGPSTTT
jgi:hypothetical protein